MKCQNQISNSLLLDINNEMPKSNIKFVIVHVCFILCIVCLCICVCECLFQNNNHKTKRKNTTTSKQHSCVCGPIRECHSIRSGASGLPYYCAPLVCVSEVIELLAAWRYNKPNLKTQKSIRVRFLHHPPLCVSEVIELLAVWRRKNQKPKKNHWADRSWY